MNFVINESQLFLLLDSVFPDLSTNRIYGYNPTYSIKSNDDEIFHYENGSVNVNPDFIEMINEFAPIKITKDVVVTIGKWIHSRTGLKPRLIWIGLKNYNVEPHLNESFDKLRARRFMHIADNYFNKLSPKDVCDYWKSEEVDDYVTETVAEMVRFITDEYPDVSAEDWHDTYDGIYQMLDSIGYSDKVRDFFYDSIDNCNLNESEDKPMKKFNRDKNPDQGKYGKMIEKIALSYFRNPDDVCDLICIKTSPNQTGLGEYILLVLMSYSMSETKLSEYIKNFVPVDLMVMINTNYHCKDED